MLQKGFIALICLLWILLVLEENPSLAQSCPNSIQGRINSIGDHKPIPFALVYLPALKISTTTDSLGYFKFCDLPVGKKQIIVKQLGFDSLMFFAEPGKKRITIHLKEKDQWLDAIDVRGKHRHFASEVVESQTIHEIELERNRGTSLGELVGKIPGVSMLNTGPTISKPVIQGLSGQRIAIVNDGVKIEGQQWGFDHAPEVDPALVDEVTIIKGSQTVRYGSEAIGGVILLEPGEIKTNNLWHGKSVSGFATNGRSFFQNAMLQKSFGPNGNGAIRISVNGKKAGNLNTARYILGNTALEEGSVLILTRYSWKNWKADLSINGFATRIGIFSGAHISSPEGIRKAFTRPDSSYRYSFGYGLNRPNQTLTHGIAKLKFTYDYNTLHQLQLLYNIQIDDRKEFDIIRRSSQCPDCPQLMFQLESQQVELAHKFKKEGYELQSGVVGLKQENIVQRSILVPNFKLYQGSVYSISSWYRGLWAYETGARLETRLQQIFRYVGQTFENPTHKFINFMGNAGVRYQINDHWHTKLNLQYSNRAPYVNELYSNGVHHGTASFEKGDEKLNPEQIWNATFSLHHRSEDVELLMNFFDTYSPNFIYLAPFGDSIITTIRGPFPFYAYQASEINMKGLDFYAHYQAFNSLSFYVKGAVIRSWNFSRNSYLIYQPADRVEIGFEFERKWKAYGFLIKFGPTGVARQRRAPNDQDFVDAPPGYVLWNGLCAFKKNKGRFKFDFSIEGQNLGNAAYRDYMNRFRYFSYDMGRNFRIRLMIPMNT